MLSIWRIHEHQIKSRGKRPETVQIFYNVPLDYRHLLGEAAGFDIPTHQRQCIGIIIDETCGLGTAAEGFNSQSTGSCEKIEDNGPLDAVGKD